MTITKNTASQLLLLGSTIALIYGFSPAWNLPDTTSGYEQRLLNETVDLIIAQAHWWAIWLGLTLFVVSRLQFGRVKKKRLSAIGQEPVQTSAIRADLNGKTYSKYRLITEGPNRGKYESVPSFHTTRTGLRDTVDEAERRDIFESGFEIHAPDPKSSK